MRFGVHLPNVGPLCDAQAVGLVARRAEAVGYDSVWVNDHLVWELNFAAEHMALGSMAAPAKADHLESLITLAYVAACTQRVRLGITVLVVPFRDPVLLAKQVATIDVYSGGRMIFGIGIGGVVDEFTKLNMTTKARGRITDDHLCRIYELWTTATCVAPGAPPSAPENFLPRPVQRPRPLVWVGGNSEVALQRTATLGDGWLPWSLTAEEYAALVPRLTEMAQAKGNARPTISGHCLVLLDGADGTRFARGRPTLEHRYSGWEMAQRRAVWGPPARMQEQLAALAEAGVEELVLGFVAETIPDYLADMETFAAAVMPGLRRP